MSSTPAVAPVSPLLRLPAVAAFVLALTVSRLLVAGATELSIDEAYYTLWSLNPGLGYLDHPPFVAWMIGAGRMVAGDSALGVRLFTVLAALPVSAAVWRMGVLLQSRAAAGLGTIWFNLTLLAGVGFLATPDIASVLCWTLALWALSEWAATRREGWWLAVGLFAGLGVLAKYTNLFIAPGLLLFLLVGRDRRRAILNWQVWAGLGVAFLAMAPTLWWNATNGWATLAFQGSRTTAAFAPAQAAGYAAEYVLSQVLIGGPVLALCLVVGAITLRGNRALPLLTALPALAYFLWHCLSGRVQVNWTAPLWPGLALAAAMAATDLWQRGGWRQRLLAIGLPLHALGGLALAVLIAVQALGMPLDLGRTDRFGELHGWRNLEATLQAEAASNGARWIATDGDYALYGELATYGHFAQSTVPVWPIGEGRRWTYLDRDLTTLGWPALLVLPEENAAFAATDLFDAVRDLGPVPRIGPRGVIETYRTYLVSAPKPAFAARWAE